MNTDRNTDRNTGNSKSNLSNVVSNVRNFVEGTFWYNSYTKKSKLLDRFYLEQFLYRAYISRECVYNGKCKSCSCNVPALFFAPTKTVKSIDGVWEKFYYSENDWNSFKEKSNEYKRWEQILQDSKMDIYNPDIFYLISDIYERESKKRGSIRLIENRSITG